MSSIPLTLKLKNKKNTVFLLIDKQSKVSDVLKELSVSLNHSGSRSGGASAEDEDLDIPVPSFETNDEPFTESNKAAISEPVDAERLRIAVANSKSELSKGWRDISGEESTLEELGVRDLAVLAYKLDSEPDFEVTVATDDEI